ncbi:MAG: DUF1553 domain-containing protein [Armatimonadetes bacterium]|nr:DUF1553 domain-containing protein [Armatimonadota bacterium]
MLGSRLIQLLGLTLGVGGFGAGLLTSPAPQAKPQEKVDFSRDILPILSDRCFKCHGPDTATRMANMRLDTAEGAFENRNGKFPVVPGKPEHSMLVERINDKDDPMPPQDSGKTLSKAEIDLLTRWIREGAVYRKRWSFEPLPAQVPVPKVSGNWPKNDIDRFILARLNQEKISPSPEAPRSRWLRRVTLDLNGLPPTEADIDAFIQDKSPDAYEKVVDRLLASPHFGERIAVDWLDAARYSDSYGYQSDLIMPSWPYRDWVIKSFNNNLPYDQFLTDQIAGDLLPNATRDDRLATAFNRLHRQSNEGGSIPLEFKTEYASDRVNTFGTAVLGLTLGCAKCHDHKFDPISQKEYYQLFAYFNNIDEYGLLLSSEIVPTPSLLLPTKEQEARRAELETARDQAQHNLEQVAEQAKPRFDKWLNAKPTDVAMGDYACAFWLDEKVGGKFKNEISNDVTCDLIGSPETVPGKNGTALKFDGDNGIIIRKLKSLERWDPFTWSFWVKDPRDVKGPAVLLHRTGGTDVGFCGFDLLLEDGYLTARVMRQWPGNAVAIKTTQPIAANQWTNIAWSYDGLSHAAGLKLYIDGKEAPTTVLNDKIWKTIHAYGDLGPSGGDWSFGQRFREAGFKGGEIDQIAYAERCLTPIEVEQIYSKFGVIRCLMDPDNHRPELLQYYLGAIDPEYRAALALRLQADKAIAEFENGIQEISVMEESNHNVPAYLLARGQYDAPRNAQTLVHRGTPKMLPALDPTGKNDRLALAKWVTRPNNPLTARVAVNRLWQMMFGTGIVETSENFGVQGSPPTHPELLDYLAKKFIDSKWNVKAILKTIALSATYREDSIHDAKLQKIDPDNKLYARGPSQRLSAEMVRDTALSASGLLNDKLGGPPVNPYQPAGLWTENNTMTPAFVQSKGADLYRRSIYSTWKRTTPVPSMLVFDATAREACIVRRPVTSTPLQALVLLNDVQFVEPARVLAERAIESNPSRPNQIQDMFMRLAGRHATDQEAKILSTIYDEQHKLFADKQQDATKLIHMGDSKPNDKLDPLDLASMTVVAQAILNSDSVIWKR